MSDVKVNSERAFSVILSIHSPWSIVHRQATRLGAGDAIMVDSELSNDMTFNADYEVSNLRLSEAWLRQWVTAPDALVGLRIARDAGWGRALTACVRQLTPSMATTSPLPMSVVVDQIGALLALVAAERAEPVRRTLLGERDLRAQIKELVVQRCTEHELTAAEVALTLGVSVRTLHRTLARFQETFGGLLMGARATTALRMLESPLFARLTAAQIGHRAGFKDPAHFTHTMRARCGATPSQLRKAGRAGRR